MRKEISIQQVRGILSSLGFIILNSGEEEDEICDLWDEIKLGNIKKTKKNQVQKSKSAR